jgi:hypothetical protein
LSQCNSGWFCHSGGRCVAGGGRRKKGPTGGAGLPERERAAGMTEKRRKAAGMIEKRRND